MTDIRPHPAGHFWIIGGGAMQLPLIQEAAELGLRSIVTDRDPHCLCAAHADLFEPLDVFDIPGHLHLADALQARGIAISGVLAAGIDAPETMAALARHLGLPGVDPAIARLVHHKADFRARLQALGHPVPVYTTLRTSDLPQLAAIGERTGYPLIIKNTDSSGSRGTRIFRQADLPAMQAVAQEAIAVSKSATALVESCWEGSEHTVETLFDIDGRFHRCFITDRHFDKADGWALETGLRHPSALAPAMQETMFQLAEQVASELGITIGAAKFDMMVTADGPRIIEMTVRLSGGFDCQFLVPAATGKRVLKAAVLTALGQRIPDGLLQPTRQRVGVTGSLWPAPGRIARIAGVDEARRLPGIEQIFFRYAEGEQIQPYTDCTRRVCFIVATGEDEASAQRNLARAAQAIHIDTVATA
jgi:biotin carboxylase